MVGGPVEVKEAPGWARHRLQPARGVYLRAALCGGRDLQYAAEVQMNVVVVDRNANTATDVARHLMKSGIAKFARPSEAEGFSGYMAPPGLAGLML
jgi:hypothetical protein